MAEQSSTATTFRAFVMLTCILLIPLAAISGTSFPSVVKAIQNGRWPTLADFRGPSENSKAGLSEAPRFNASSTVSSPQPGVSTQAFPRSSAPTSAVVPANYETPIANSPGQSTSFPQNNGPENRDRTAPSEFARSGLENRFSTQSERTQGGRATEGANSASSVPQLPASGHSDPDATIKAIHTRLKQLGATYYLLEPCGDRMESFRCFCKVAVGGNPHFTRNFQQIDADPVKAMTMVLQQIEDWQKHG
jgi:hypothetical protein